MGQKVPGCGKATLPWVLPELCFGVVAFKLRSGQEKPAMGYTMEQLFQAVRIASKVLLPSRTSNHTKQLSGETGLPTSHFWEVTWLLCTSDSSVSCSESSTFPLCQVAMVILPYLKKYIHNYNHKCLLGQPETQINPPT